MTRKIAILSVLLLAFAGFTPAFGQMQGPQSTMNVTGDWAVQMTGDHFVAGRVHLSQVGGEVVGSAQAPSSMGSGALQFSGKFDGNKLSGKWRSPKGETGWLTFEFTSSHQAFSGDWGYNGRKANGHIVARKLKSTQF